MLRRAIKATILNIIVALSVVVIVLLSVYILFGAKIKESISLVNKITIDTDNKEVKVTQITKDKVIKNYPEYGTKYAQIKIPKIDVDLPVYFGDTLEVLKKGVRTFKWKLFSG